MTSDTAQPEFTIFLPNPSTSNQSQLDASVQLVLAACLSKRPSSIVKIEGKEDVRWTGSLSRLPVLKIEACGTTFEAAPLASICWILNETLENAESNFDQSTWQQSPLALQVFHYPKGKFLKAVWIELFEESQKEAFAKLNEIVSLPVRAVQVADGLEWNRVQESNLKPLPGHRNVLITAALPYVNNVPHLGNIIGAVLSADVYARYCRLRGYQTLFICGTDEYGTATETKALEDGVTCAELCEKYYRLHSAVYNWFQIDFDTFGRTSTPKQTEITHEIFKSLYERGYFFEQDVEQTYCAGCARFLADRFVEGNCPRCGYDDARGDQCDKCGRLHSPTDLLNPRCKLCRGTPERRSSRHLFLDLTRLQPECAAFVDSSSVKGRWSSNSTAISKAWLNEGLQPRCMTRDLTWGTPVPVSGFEKKVFYVWFDAPIGYISITAAATEHWRSWWMAGKAEESSDVAKVELVQFMGKDNVPFHTVTFPSTLLGTGEPWTMLHHISTTEYLNYETGKFSKSRGIGVFGTDARDTGIPASIWRYYLLSTRPETSDSAFSWADFGLKCNSELLANLGNLVSRVTRFVEAKLSTTVPERSSPGALEHDLEAKVNEELAGYYAAMEETHLKAGLRHVMAISALGNQYLAESKLDNKLLSADPLRCGTVLGVALDLIYLLSVLVEPFMPSSSEDIRRILNAPSRRLPEKFEIGKGLLPGHNLNPSFHLFERIDEATLKVFQERFGGKQK